MDKKLNNKKENLVHLILWSITFLAPILSLYISTSASDSQETFEWNEIFHIWVIYTPFLVAFLIHNFLLAPLLIYRRKKVLYVAATLCTVAAFMAVQYMNRPEQGPAEREGEPRHEMRLGERPPLPPDFKGELPPRHHKPPTIIGEHDIVQTIVLVLLLGMNLGVKIYFKSDSEHEQLKQLERENLRQQLEYLKYQISPHFFMNTLNNIHALVDIDPQKAQNSIVVLSKMMRYLLYESNQAMVPLSKEIDFINNYVALMRMRYTEKVHINVNIPDPITDVPQTSEVPPMLTKGRGCPVTGSSPMDTPILTMAWRMMRNPRPKAISPPKVSGRLPTMRITRVNRMTYNISTMMPPSSPYSSIMMA